MISNQIIKKPKILYHASSNKFLNIIKVRKDTFRDVNEGPVVFGTPEIAYASCFLIPGTEGSWIKISRWSNNPNVKGVWHFICGDRKKFDENDIGGTIYKISPLHFETDSQKGAGLSEWISKKDAKIIGRIDYDSALEAMIENGVQVIFTDLYTIARMGKSKDHGYSIAKSLISEYKILGNNYSPLG